jgi:hypothetical protein
MNTLQKTAIAAAISGLFAPAAFAQATPAPEASPVTANVSVVSDYRFRGKSVKPKACHSRAALTTRMRAVFILVTGTVRLAG